MSDGHWIDLARAWHDTDVCNCEVCGRLLPRRAWVFADADGASVRSCGPDCAELYETYVRVRMVRDADH